MKPVLVTGATGTLGRAFHKVCAERGLACTLTSRAELDIADEASVEAALDRYEPWLVVNAAGYVRVDDAETDLERCRRENTQGAEVLARACARHNLGFVTFSSDLVFDGAKQEAYDEGDRPRPLSVYGRTKAEAEERVLDALPDALVVRTGAFFGPWDEHNFVTWTCRSLAAGRAVAAADDVVVSPTYVPDLVHACLDLAIDRAGGIWHLANAGQVTWAELARQAARLSGADESRVMGVSRKDLPWKATRPTYSALRSNHGALLPPLEDALSRYGQAAGNGVVCGERSAP